MYVTKAVHHKQIGSFNFMTSHDAEPYLSDVSLGDKLTSFER